LTNARRLRAGRRLIEDARIEDVVSAMRNTGLLQAKTDEGGTNVSGATR
jgi:tRNA G46 methylase TrmB